MPKFDIAFVGSIEADDYEQAIRLAGHLAAGVGDSDQIPFSAVECYEHDNTGQRVLYLHPENEESDLDYN